MAPRTPPSNRTGRKPKEDLLEYWKMHEERQFEPTLTIVGAAKKLLRQRGVPEPLLAKDIGRVRRRYTQLLKEGRLPEEAPMSEAFRLARLQSKKLRAKLNEEAEATKAELHAQARRMGFEIPTDLRGAYGEYHSRLSALYAEDQFLPGNLIHNHRLSDEEASQRYNQHHQDKKRLEREQELLRKLVKVEETLDNLKSLRFPQTNSPAEMMPYEE